MSRLADGYVTIRILRMLSTPIEGSQAYKLGIVDKDGKKIKNPVTGTEKDSYSMLQRFVFKLQRALMKSPDRNAKRLLTVAAALSILRENKELDNLTDEDLEIQLDLFENFEEVQRQAKLLEHNVLSFKSFNEEMGVAGGAIAGLGVDNPSKPNQAEPGRDPVMMPMIRRKKKKKDGNG